jgi:DNA-binding transcriptional ArsR family regulator
MDWIHMTLKRSDLMSKDSITREEWEQVVNDIKHVRASTQSMNRIMVLNNRNIIVADILEAIGNSPLRAAALHLTKELITAAELSSKIGIDPKHLSRTIKPLQEKSYIVPYREGKRIFYKREEKVDLVGYDNIEEIKVLLDKWRAKGCEQEQ